MVSLSNHKPPRALRQQTATQIERTAAVTTFVLVHGAWLGGWCWHRVSHIRDIVAVLECEDLRDVVLVGHSYGGMVITGVAGFAEFGDRARSDAGWRYRELQCSHGAMITRAGELATLLLELA